MNHTFIIESEVNIELLKELINTKILNIDIVNYINLGDLIAVLGSIDSVLGSVDLAK